MEVAAKDDIPMSWTLFHIFHKYQTKKKSIFASYILHTAKNHTFASYILYTTKNNIYAMTKAYAILKNYTLMQFKMSYIYLV